MTEPPRLFRINIEVGDLEQAGAFYGALFSQTVRPQRGSRFYLDAWGVTLQVVQIEAPHTAAKALYFEVKDLAAMHARAAGLGCLSSEDVHGEPAGQPIRRPWGERSFYCDDPWGNPLCFVEAGTAYTG